MWPFRLVPHPLAVVAHVLGQAGRAPPVVRLEQSCRDRLPCLSVGGIGRARGPAPTVGCTADRRLAGETGRDLDEGLVDEHGHGVQVRGVGFQAQALGLQGDGAAAGEGVQQGRGLAAGRVLADLGPGPLQQGLVVDVLPFHQLFHEAEEALALPALGLLGGEAFRVAGGVVHHLGEDHRAAGGQGAPGPPQVQGAGVAVADGFFPGRLPVDGLQGQGDFDELLGVVHGRFASQRLVRRR